MHIVANSLWRLGIRDEMNDKFEKVSDNIEWFMCVVESYISSKILFTHAYKNIPSSFLQYSKFYHHPNELTIERKDFRI